MKTTANLFFFFPFFKSKSFGFSQTCTKKD
uniref:Uncharacterized protein n=1 Tax=Rhizophora mucronata TaxID=61149 RepID=A0A2P2NN13_RHIMU